MLAASMLLLMACSDYAGDSPTAPTPPGPSPSEQITLQLQPAQVQLDVGDTRSLKADLRDGDGNPATGFTVNWSSPDPPVAEVDESGVVLGNGADSVYVTAEAVRHSDGTVLWDSALVAVRGDMEPVRELEVDPESIEMSAGSAQAVKATPKDGKGKSQENRPIEWSSSNEDVATVDDSGMVKAMGTGDATISVRSGGHQRDLPVKVQSSPGTSVASVTVTPTSDTLAPGERVTLEATVEDSAGEVLDRPVQWSSSNATFASVDDNGVVAAAAEGEATITATSGGESGSATIVVSEDGEKIGDDEEPGAPATIEIEPSSAALETDESVTLDVTVRDSAGNVLDREVEWLSSDASVATVDGGTVTGEAAGEATVTATSGDAEGTASLTVSEEEPAAVAGVEVEPSSLALEPGQTATLEATVTDAEGNVLERDVEWSSSDASVASVDGGTVTGEAAGEATVTATSGDAEGTASVTVEEEPAAVAGVEVEPSSLDLEPGQTATLEATVTDADGNVLDRAVEWSSSDASVATVDGSGVVSAEAEGEATITATSEGVSGSAMVAVTASTATPTASNSGAYTHEPSGYSPVVEFDGSAVPPSYYDEPICNSGPMRVGCAVSDPAFSDGKHTSIADATAPVDDQVLRVVFPKGMGGGGSPGFFNLWGPRSGNVDWLSISDDPPNEFDLEEMYYSAHVRLTSGPGDGKWEMGNHLKLLGYFSFAQSSPSYNLGLPYVLDFHGDDTPKLIESSPLQAGQQGPSSLAEEDKLTVWSYGEVQVDRWHHLELLATLNDIGENNGTLRVYVDGQLVLEREGIMWRTAEHPRGFTVIHVGQVWGGPGETRSRTDYVDIDNIYVSGVELAESGS